MPASRESKGGVAAEESLSDKMIRQLAERGVIARGEVELRLELERRAPSYTLVRLTPAAARKWKARYRILLAADMLDAQTVAEAYARAILYTIANAERTEPPKDA